ncbi:hypothetical protein GCM10010451_17680 [Streptomyces virens]|uniref:Phage resistance protein n=1 Tax=Streptomyces virens TaxID=285572 RepID=A0ABP6P893_9ACTN|nr:MULTISPECIES: phage resistance protein [Streptomyces]MBA8978659.1 hypothetical protein [Streptomyces calvus]MYS26041.1 phage resistance protein [Streptomyces sp. SID7804]
MAAPARERQAPLLKDLMDLPSSVSTSSYVLKLAEAVTEEGSQKALQDYVVTRELLGNFREALGLISTALETQSSKAAYLHGSFGAGKSHFMAVLHALLSNSSAARARQEFDPLYQEFGWLREGGKKFLLVPYHMLNAESLEHRVLGGYVDWVAKHHKDAPTPRVYRTDALFDQLRDMRQDFGDEQFLAQLNAGAEGEVDEWGNSAAFWTSERLSAALDAAEVHDKSVRLDLENPSTPAELRARLTQDAMRTVARQYGKIAAQGDGFIPLDEGLSVIAEHAKSLNYDGLVLFLDELMLWLTMMMQDEKRALRESGKFTNFVEGGDSRRAIPVISFIARQRDLREITGEEMHGTAELAMQHNLNFASGRIESIKLEDRNLPEVAHERLLKPRSAEAEQEVQAGLDRLLAANPGAVRDTWLGDDQALVGSGEEPLRKAYPFTPAFMDALVQISSALQRNRTGMKLMGEILADQRNRLRLGDLVSLGDLYPYLGKGGDKPFQDATRVVFESAERLYKTKLRPYLLTTHKVNDEEAVAYEADPESVPAERRPPLSAFLGDDRIMRTLLLSALAPGAVSLQNLTVERLLALNHGSIKSRFKGGEVQALEGKLSQWAGQFAEIKVSGSGAKASVLLELTDIDLDSILANANTYTQTRFQRDLAERILRRQFDLGEGRVGDELSFVWKGSPRTVEVTFANVRDKDRVSDQSLKPATDGLWRIVVDYPFDDGEFGPREDAMRIDGLRNQESPDGPARTLAWLPTHLSRQARDSFRRLTVIDNVLSDEDRFHGTFAKHLGQDKRVRAWQLLEAQRDTLTREAEKAFKQAYGLADKKESEVQLGFDDHLDPVYPVPGLSLPIGASFSKAVRVIAARLLERQFPAHPVLDQDNPGRAVTTADAKKVYGLVKQAAAARDRRVEVPSGDRNLMRRLAEPLKLGTMGEAYFELSPYWTELFTDQARADRLPAGDDLTYVRLTDWLDRPEPRGLHETVRQLVIASFAEIDDRVWVRGGAVQDVSLAFTARPGDALRTQPRPAESDWEEALSRFESLFGDKPKSRLYRGQIINQFATAVREQARSLAEDAGELVRRLEGVQNRLGLDEADLAGRLALARHSLALVKQLAETAEAGSAAARRTVETLAGFDLRGVSPLRYGTSLVQAKKVATALANADWDTLDLAETEGPEGHSVLERLKAAARSDQQTNDLAAALEAARREVIALLRANRPGPPQPQPPAGPSGADDISLKGDDAEPSVPSTHTAGGGARRAGGGRTKARTAAAEFAAEIRALVEENPEAEIDIKWQVVDE